MVIHSGVFRFTERELQGTAPFAPACRRFQQMGGIIGIFHHVARRVGARHPPFGGAEPGRAGCGAPTLHGMAMPRTPAGFRKYRNINAVTLFARVRSAAWHPAAACDSFRRTPSASKGGLQPRDSDLSTNARRKARSYFLCTRTRSWEEPGNT